MTKVIGITGSIGMGKSTVASHFADLGAKVSDADSIVHKIFNEDSELIEQIDKYFPEAVSSGVIDRANLGRIVFSDLKKLKKLESLLHPKVRAENLNIIKNAKAGNIALLVLDIPLLYETGAEEICDIVIVVTTSFEIQRERVLARTDMTEEKFESILSKQLPDEQKRLRADYIIDTSNGLDDSMAQVEALISKL